MPKISVDLIGRFFDNHSLSIVNRHIALELARHGGAVDLTITPRDRPDPKWLLDPRQVRTLETLADKEHGTPDVEIRHVYPPAWRWPRAEKTKVIFIQPWEYVRIPFEWQYKFETFADGLITPSAWTADNFLHSGLNPDTVFVVPNGYDPAIFNPTPEKSRFFDDAKFTFLFVGNHQKRKGLDILLNVWKETFVKGEPVRLFIKDSPQVYGRNKVAAIVADLRKTSGCAEIVYCDDALSERDMANLYKNAPVLVHPYRGEGFAMHVQEALACGAWPIVTRGGPTDEFVPDGIGDTLEAQVVMLDMTSPELFAIKPGDSLTLMGWHAQLLEPKAEALKAALLAIFQHPDRSDQLAKAKAQRPANTWEAVGRRYLDVVKTVHGRHRTTRRRRNDFDGTS